MRVLFLLSTALAFGAAPPIGQNNDPNAASLARCKETGLPDKERIAACTSVIDSRLVSGADLAQAYGFRGNVRFAEHDYALAIRDYDQEVALKPSWGALTLRGMAHAKTGAYDAAIADCSHALQMFPQLAMAQSCVDDAQKSKARLTAGSKP